MILYYNTFKRELKSPRVPRRVKHQKPLRKKESQRKPQKRPKDPKVPRLIFFPLSLRTLIHTIHL